VRRHEVLRSVFRESDGEPVQVARPPASVPLPVADLSALPPVDRRREVQRLAQGEAERPFVLSRGPLLRALLAVLDRTDHAVLLTLHHIVSDGWSTGILVRELGTLYAAFSRGERSPLAEPEIQYADFAGWQRSWLTGEVLEGEIDYWRRRLEGAPPALDLPADRPRPPVQTQRGAAVTFAIPAELMRELRALGRRQGATLFMTLLAAFQTLLARSTGQLDVNVGTLVAGRSQLRTEDLIGFFINTLVLRSDLSGEPAFSELLSQVRGVTLEAFAHQDLPFERLVEELQPARDLSRTPLFQVLFALQNAPVGALEVPGMRLEPLLAERRTSLFDLALTLEDGGIGSAEYSTDLFAAATIERLMGNLVALLEGAVAAPESAVGDLPLLRAAERHQIVREWNDTARVWPRQLRLHDLIVEQARRAPDALALVQGGDHLTYGELLHRAAGLARSLRALGAGPEVTVALCLERSLEMGVALLGSLLSGATWVPLEPTYPPERLSFMLEDSGAAVLLTQERLLATLPSGSFATICLDRELADAPREAAADQAAPESAAYVIYTSGSTGRPKGVVVSHEALVSYALEVVRFCRLGPADRVLQFAPLGFDVIVEEVFPIWVAGGAVVLEPAERLASPLDLWAALDETAVTVMELPTAYFHELVYGLEVSGGRLPASLRLVIVASEKLLPERVVSWHRHGVDLLHVYGLTEATVTSSYHLLPAGAELDDPDLPIGRPMADTSLLILDPGLWPVPAGVAGELCVGGVGLARGYLGRPELTAERFVPDPFSDLPGARLYRTGDLARLRSDGNLHFLGRVDFQAKVRGFRIEPGEIESRLAEHPGVREVLVAVREDRPGDKRLVAYLVATALEGEAEPPGGGELRGFLRETLPDYMVPSAFVFLEALPLTPNGKVDRRRLPVPPDERPGTLLYTAPRNAAEEVLARIWSELLGRDRIGIFDDFFELGGHSLLAARTTARLRSVFGLELPLRALFEAPTVAGLGEALARLAGEPGIVDQIAQVYLEVEGLSEDEMRGILSES
ncbi:MAG TPA: amino acid adenylation domain-containing protein, partial [Thermoanaerobaculia bacterium]|nr:amino acid adenylation domain-containing protein [Thermoanaerobaculia bacterium]